jgi:hypothetical protein
MLSRGQQNNDGREWDHRIVECSQEDREVMTARSWTSGQQNVVKTDNRISLAEIGLHDSRRLSGGQQNAEREDIIIVDRRMADSWTGGELIRGKVESIELLHQDEILVRRKTGQW